MGEGIWGDQLAAFPIRPWMSLDLSQRLDNRWEVNHDTQAANLANA